MIESQQKVNIHPVTMEQTGPFDQSTYMPLSVHLIFRLPLGLFLPLQLFEQLVLLLLADSELLLKGFQLYLGFHLELRILHLEILSLRSK